MKFKIIKEYKLGWNRHEEPKIVFYVLGQFSYSEKPWSHLVSDLPSMEAALNFCRKYKDTHAETDLEL